VSGISRVQGFRLLGVLWGFALLSLPFGASAERAPGRFMSAVDLGTQGSGERARVHFDEPVRYIRHRLVSGGREVLVEVEPVVGARAAREIRDLRTVVRPSAAAGSLVEEVVFDGGPPGVVEMRFSARVEVIVRPGSDGRTIDVFFRRPRKARAAGPTAPRVRGPAANPEADARVRKLVDDARQALTRGDLDPALATLRQALSLPETEATREALELLGIARERNGQLAHAKAEYQAYLARYPDSEGAPRVEQRLRSLLSARGKPTTASAPAPGAEPGLELEAFGSIATIYRRDQRDTEATGSIVTNDSALTDLFVGWRGRTPGWNLRGEFSGSYEYALLSGAPDETRVRSLSIEAAPADGNWFVEAGRQTANQLGVIGRFDGFRYGYAFTDSLGLRVLGGTSIDLFESSTPNADKPLIGIGAEFSAMDERLHGEAFAIHQRAFGEADRSAVGGGLRYIADAWFASLFVDYDLGFQSLNTLSLIGNWGVRDDTTVNVFLDHRNAPILTTSNALIGQPERKLDDLRERLTGVSLEDLAEDRTSRSSQATVGVTHRLSERLEIAADVTLSRFSSTNASAGVAATEGTGTEPSYFMQLIGTDVVTEGDTMVVGVRHFDGRLLQTYSLLTSWRVAVTRAFRIQPRLNIDYRTPESGTSYVQARPILRLDWRWRNFTFDLEGNGEWIQERAIDAGDELGWGVAAGMRMDF